MSLGRAEAAASTHWVCVGGDVSVNYKSADGHENKMGLRVCARDFKPANFMNDCDICMIVCGTCTALRAPSFQSMNLRVTGEMYNIVD